MNYEDKSMDDLIQMAKAETAAINEALEVLAAIPTSKKSEESIQGALSELSTIMDEIWVRQNPEAIQELLI